MVQDQRLERLNNLGDKTEAVLRCNFASPGFGGQVQWPRLGEKPNPQHRTFLLAVKEGLD